MAQVSRSVGRETGRFRVMKARFNHTLSRIDHKQARGAVLDGALLNWVKVCYVNTAQCNDDLLVRNGCVECQVSQPDRVACESSEQCRNRKEHVIERNCNCLSKAENDVVSLRGGVSAHWQNVLSPDLPLLEDCALHLREFSHTIQDMLDCHILAENCKNDITLFAWLGIQNRPKTKAWCSNSEDRDRFHLPSDTFSQKRVSMHRISCWKKRNFLSTAFHTQTHPENRHEQRAFCTVLSVPERQLNYCVQSGSPGTMSFSRPYSWTGQNSSSKISPLYRSKTAYYDILQVSPSATQAQIKTAYYKQSFIYHPDKNAGSEMATQRFSEISEAYNILGSIALRRKYDRGILNLSDVQGAGKPSARETRSSSTTAQQQRRPRHTHAAGMGGKKIFDFDAFYQAHYGEQLQREKELRLRKEKLRQQQQEVSKKWKLEKMTEMTVGMLLVLTTFILVSLKSGD